MRRTSLAVLLMIAFAPVAESQGVPTWIRRGSCPPGMQCTASTDSLPGEMYKLIGQGGLTLQTNVNPVVNVEVLKYQLWATETFSLPFVLLSGLSLTHTNDIHDVIASILDEAGGIANLKLGGENLKLLPKWWPKHPVYGLLVDVYGGLKVTDVPQVEGGVTAPTYVAGLDARFNARVVFPVTAGARRREFDPANLAGSFQIKMQGAFSRVTNETYRNLLGGEPLDESLNSASVSGTLVVTNVIHLEGGYLFSVSDSRLTEQKGRLWFSFRMAR